MTGGNAVRWPSRKLLPIAQGREMTGVDQVVPGFGEQFPQAVLDTGEFRGERTLVLRPADVLAACHFLRDRPSLAYDLCIFVSIVDQLEADLLFGAVSAMVTGDGDSHVSSSSKATANPRSGSS